MKKYMIITITYRIISLIFLFFFFFWSSKILNFLIPLKFFLSFMLDAKSILNYTSIWIYYGCSCFGWFTFEYICIVIKVFSYCKDSRRWFYNIFIKIAWLKIVSITQFNGIGVKPILGLWRKFLKLLLI